MCVAVVVGVSAAYRFLLPLLFPSVLMSLEAVTASNVHCIRLLALVWLERVQLLPVLSCAPVRGAFVQEDMLGQHYIGQNQKVYQRKRRRKGRNDAASC